MPGKFKSVARKTHFLEELKIIFISKDRRLQSSAFRSPNYEELKEVIMLDAHSMQQNLMNFSR